jgi:hypothetical protein
MMKNYLLLALLLVLLCAGCAPAVKVTPSATFDIPATTEALAGTIVAGTLTAMPTRTPPPTQTETPIPPTETPLPPTETASPSPTLTPEPFFGTLAAAGLPNNGKMGFIKVDNNSDFMPITLTIQGVTASGEKPIYIAYKIERSFTFEIPFGSYTYVVDLAGKRTLSGDFRINNYDKTTINIQNNKVIITGP